ncbi:YHYH domain-containing protein [Neobacillus cucumis]|uniref:YHYH domain-containing protein n=1 Tax=Neobacillus cucumis TaxID=1740721 RepID=UPI0019646036|nr:YHYH domain-containing protein [Neobacillus cucumis]MBM7652528.1 hypothetical protein [Neobacillus cucumis]
MGKKIVFLGFIFTILFGSIAYAHPGRTDSNGGHTCRTNCGRWGLSTGEYHYHNGGGATTSSSSSRSTSSSTNINDKDCTDFATYDDMIAYWNSKGYSATYDPENLDGWGNGQVDDGIPCEAPYGYDLTLINNSPQQKAAIQEEKDNENGEKAGYPAGINDAYQEKPSNMSISNGSEAYKVGYAVGYNKGYDEGQKKIESAKSKATNDGYSLGGKQDKMDIPTVYASHAGLKKSFEDGFNKAVAERVEEKKKQLKEQGYSDGKKDVNSPPLNGEAMFVEAYQEGYNQGQSELKKGYMKQGYEAAFTMLKYQDPILNNDKFTDWYKEGFDSNKEIIKIKNKGYQLGKAGEDLNIPPKYKKAETIFKHHYQLGYKEYEDKQNKIKAAGGAGAVVLLVVGGGWYGFRKKRNRKKEIN